MRKDETPASAGSLRNGAEAGPAEAEGSTLDFRTGGALRGPLGDRVDSYLSGSRSGLEGERDLKLGDRVGRFRILERIGAGGMGEVFRGRDELLGREVAVKRLHPDRGLSEAARVRFFREARILAGLEHENICQVYDFVEEDGDEYLVLELIRGKPLSDESVEDLDEEERWSVARQVTSALEAAHRRGIVHRDLKPANVLRQDDGKVKVLDFGIARSLSTAASTPTTTYSEASSAQASVEPGSAREPGLEVWDSAVTTQGQVMGTPRFMSPEQAAGEEVLPSSDMYSLGLVLQQLFAGRSALDDLAHLSSGEVSGPSVATSLDPALRKLLADLLQEEPANRPTAGETLRRLERLRHRRHRRRGLAVAALGTLLLSSAGWLWVQRAEQPLLEPGQVGRVAILPVENETGDSSLDWVEFGLPELVGETLGSVEGIEIVPFDDLEKVGLSVRDADRTSDEIRRLTRAVGAHLVVQARLNGTLPRLQLVYQVLSGAGSFGQRRLHASDPMQAASDLAARLAGRIRPESTFAGLADRLSENATANALFARGVHARRTRGYEICSSYFRVASDIDPSFWQAKIQLARCLNALGRRQEGLRIAEELLGDGQVGVGASSAEVEAAALAQSGHILGGLADHHESIRRLEKAAVLYQQLGQTEEQARAVSSAAYAYRHLWSWTGNEASRVAAIRKTDEAAALFLRVNSPAAQVRGLYYRASALQMRGELDAAGETMRHLVTLAEDVGEKHYLGLSLIRLATLVESPREIEEHLLRAVEVSRSIQNYTGAATASRNLGLLYKRLGSLERAESTFRDALALAERGENANVINATRSNLARLLIDLERPEEAVGLLELEFDAARADKLSYGLLAEALGDLERWAEAIEAQERSREIAPDDWRAEDQELLDRYRRGLERSGSVSSGG